MAICPHAAPVLASLCPQRSDLCGSHFALRARKFGKIVICGATTGFNLEFDVRHLWMRQKQILGSHFANAYQAERANQLIIEGKLKPVLDQVFPFLETGRAHALMAANKHKGKMGIAVQAEFKPAP